MSDNQVEVEFPQGKRWISVSSWEPRVLLPAKPIFDLPGYSVHETVDGKYIATKDVT